MGVFLGLFDVVLGLLVVFFCVFLGSFWVAVPSGWKLGLQVVQPVGLGCFLGLFLDVFLVLKVPFGGSRGVFGNSLWGHVGVQLANFEVIFEISVASK